MSTALHPMPSNRPSFASFLRDLRDDATCTTHYHSFTSFEVKLWNPSSTCFSTKQAARCQRMSSHRLHPLIDFEAQTDKPPPTWFWGPNQETFMVILRTKSSNRWPWFWGLNQEIVWWGHMEYNNAVCATGQIAIGWATLIVLFWRSYAILLEG
jgi:hypothetical protein